MTQNFDTGKLADKIHESVEYANITTGYKYSMTTPRVIYYYYYYHFIYYDFLDVQWI